MASNKPDAAAFGALAIERQAIDDGTCGRQTAEQCVFSIEHGLLVFLQILVIATRQSFERRQQSQQVTE